MRKEGNVEIDRRERAERETCNGEQVVRRGGRQPELENLDKSQRSSIYIHRIKLDKCSYITLFKQQPKS